MEEGGVRGWVHDWHDMHTCADAVYTSEQCKVYKRTKGNLCFTHKGLYDVVLTDLIMLV